MTQPKGTVSRFEEAVGEFEDAWLEGQEQSGGGVLEDGDYQAKVSIARVDVTPWSDDEYQLAVRFEDIDGKGGVWMNLSLNGGVERVKYSAGVVKRFGYTGPLSGIEQWVADGNLDDLVCAIKVQTKPGKEGRDYTNVYLNDVLGKMSEEQRAAKADEDIPFSPTIWNSRI